MRRGRRRRRRRRRPPGSLNDGGDGDGSPNSEEDLEFVACLTLQPSVVSHVICRLTVARFVAFREQKKKCVRRSSFCFCQCFVCPNVFLRLEFFLLEKFDLEFLSTLRGMGVCLTKE